MNIPFINTLCQTKMATFLTTLLSLLLVPILCQSEELATAAKRDPSFLKLLVMHYPHMRPSEPYTYPGPSPPVKPPIRYPEPYMYIPPMNHQNRLDYNKIPKWCKTMWEREECGMKCWMLRKICRNIAKQIYEEENIENHPDSESSPSIPHNFYKPYSPYFYYHAKPKPSVTYSKTSVPNTYIAKPSWQYPHLRRSSYYYYRNPTMNTEYGLNPQFTYVEGHEKLYTTTEKTKSENVTESTNYTSTSTTTETPAFTQKTRTKGVHPVQVRVVTRYPQDSPVTTISPLLLDYDNTGVKGYYGDRVFMSAMMPVSDRQLQMDYLPSTLPSEEDVLEFLDDFDEMMIDP